MNIKTPNQYLASVDYTGDDTTTDFTIPFKSLAKYLYIKVDDVLISNTLYTFTDNSDQVVFHTAPKLDSKIHIYRDSDASAIKVDFMQNATLKEADLDTAYLANLALIQELYDGLIASGSNTILIDDLLKGFRYNKVNKESEVYFDNQLRLRSTADGIEVLTRIIASAIEADVIGNLTGDVTGNLTGNVDGNLTGDVTGNLTGHVNGSLTGNVIGNLQGNVVGNVTGDLTGDVYRDGLIHVKTLSNAGTELYFNGDRKLTTTIDGGRLIGKWSIDTPVATVEMLVFNTVVKCIARGYGIDVFGDINLSGTLNRGSKVAMVIDDTGAVSFPNTPALPIDLTTHDIEELKNVPALVADQYLKVNAAGDAIEYVAGSGGNFVTLDTEQTIRAVKTFADNVNMDRGLFTSSIYNNANAQFRTNVDFQDGCKVKLHGLTQPPGVTPLPVTWELRRLEDMLQFWQKIDTEPAVPYMTFQGNHLQPQCMMQSELLLLEGMQFNSTAPCKFNNALMDFDGITLQKASPAANLELKAGATEAMVVTNAGVVSFPNTPLSTFKELPPLVADKYLKVNTAGTAFEYVDISGGGGGTPANMVTTDTDQNITGTKWFKNALKFGSNSYDHSALNMGMINNTPFLEFKDTKNPEYTQRIGGGAYHEFGIGSYKITNNLAQGLHISFDGICVVKETIIPGYISKQGKFLSIRQKDEGLPENLFLDAKNMYFRASNAQDTSQTPKIHISNAICELRGTWQGSVTPSSLDLKTNIQPLNGLSKIQLLQPLQWDWERPEYSNEQHETIGFSAESYEKVFPELVGEYSPIESHTGPEGTEDTPITQEEQEKIEYFKGTRGIKKAITSMKMDALVVDAIQQLAKENHALRLRIEALEARGDE